MHLGHRPRSGEVLWGTLLALRVSTNFSTPDLMDTRWGCSVKAEVLPYMQGSTVVKLR
jgi:hypothetical protein